MNSQTRDPARLSRTLLPRNRSTPDFAPIRIIPRNRSGDIPITILVIGIILICCIAIVSFFSSTIKMRNSFIGIGLVEELNSQIEGKIFNGENPAGLYVEKKVTRGVLFWAREVLLFSVRYDGRP